MESVQTNIVIVDVEKTGKTPEQLIALFRSKGVLLTPGNYTSIRAVTHMDVSMADVRKAVSIIKEAVN